VYPTRLDKRFWSDAAGQSLSQIHGVFEVGAVPTVYPTRLDKRFWSDAAGQSLSQIHGVFEVGAVPTP